MKFHHILTFVSLTHAAYISRMTVNRVRAPSVFRPGVAIQRPNHWNHQRLMPAASFRTPYVVYRSPSHTRYAVKHYGPSTRNVLHGQWRTTSRVPGLSPATPEYEFVRAASAQNLVHANSDAIHTIPAPNLSFSEKPIVVVDATDHRINPATEFSKPTYEVTENPEHVFQIAKIGTPVGFSKPQVQTIQATPELQTLIRNGAALQMASDYGLSAISIPQSQQMIPQQFTVQGANIVGFNGLPSQQDLLNSGAEGIMIPPNALYQSDPLFLQKLQNQLLQRFPAVEFIPYAAEIPSQNAQVHQNAQPHQNADIHQSQPQRVQELFLLENEELKQKDPFVESESKNVVQRETQEGSLITLIPKNLIVANITEKEEISTTPAPQNITVEVIAADTKPVSTTIKYVIETTEKQNTTPIYYAQVGQNVGDIVAKGFYSAINDVRAAAALEQVEKPQEIQNSTTTINPDLKPYFIQKTENTDNKTTEIKPLLGVPFTKPVNVADSVKVAYTLLRADDKEPKATQEGTVFAGQIVEASISEDHEFNQEKANMIKRPPLRLFAVTEKKDVTSTTTTSSMPKISVVKAKIPPKSKLTFDEQTGEPVLRIYASYVDSPAQRDIVTSKLASLKQIKDTAENWKSATVKAVDKTQGFDSNQVTQFGLKLRSRSDDYIPLFDEYDE